jgi:hypothetical protein
MFTLDQEIDGEAMMTLSIEEIDELLSEKNPDGTIKKPTIGARRKFVGKLEDWRKMNHRAQPSLEQKNETSN